MSADDGGGGSGEGGGESEEQVLIEHDDAPGGQMHQREIRVLRWVAQYFKPTLPDDALHWKITRVRFRARRGGPSGDGTVLVQIREATAALKPDTTILAAATLNESDLSTTFEWVDVPIGPVGELDVGKGYCLVIRYGAGWPEVTRIQYETGGNPMTPNTHGMATDTAGLIWTNPTDDTDIRFGVHGTVTTGDP